MIKKSGNLSALNYLSQKFYCFNLLLLIRGNERGQLFSMFLLLMKGYIFLIVGIYNEEIDKISQMDHNLKVLKNIDFINKYDSADTVQAVSLGLNLIVLLYLLWQYLKFLHFGFFNFINISEKGNSSVGIVEVNEDDFLLKIVKLMQDSVYKLMNIYMALYQFIFQVPIVYFSLVQINHSMAPINLVFSLFIGSISVDTDYNYSTLSQDCMGRPYNPYTYILFLFEQLILFLIVVSNNNIDNLLIALYFFLNGWFSCVICPYYTQKTKFWNIFAQFYYGTLSMTIFITSQKEIANNVSSLLAILYVPLFYKLSILCCDQQNKMNQNMLEDIFSENPTIRLNQVDKVMRLDLFQELDNGRQDNCKKKEEIKRLKTLTNSQYQLKMLSKEAENNFEDEDLIKQFLKELIRKIQRKKSEEQQKIIYLIYLLEIMNCKRSYWVEYSEARKGKLTLKQEQILMSIHQNFLKQKEILSKTLQFNNPFDTQYYGVLNFEERVSKAYELMDIGMKNKVELLVLMKNKQIIVNPLIQKVSFLRETQKKLRDELNNLALINNNNPDLLSLQICYLETLSFSEKDLKFGFNSSSIYNNNFSQLNGKQIRQRITKQYNKNTQNVGQFNEKHSQFDENNLYDKNSCVVFASISDSVNLIFRKVSNNFKEIFSITPSEAIGKKVDIIMPTTFPIATKHKQYIASFFKNSDNDKSNISQKTIFGQNSQGLIVALKIDIRLNYCHELSELGFCTQIRKVNDSDDYVLFHSQSLNFMGITQNIKDYVFSKCTFNKNTDLVQFFPFLLSIRKNFNNQSLKMSTNGTEWEANTTIYPKEVQSVNSDNLLATNRFNEELISQKLKTNLEYMMVLQNKKDNFNATSQTFGSNIMKIQSDKEYSFFLMDVQLSSADYKELDNLSYLKITKLKNLTPSQNGPLILMHLRDNIELYTSIFSKTIIERLSGDVENKYRKASLLEQKKGSNLQNSLLMGYSQSNLLQSTGIKAQQVTNMEDLYQMDQNSKQLYLQSISNQYQNQINEIKPTVLKINQEIQNIGNQIQIKRQIDEIVEEDMSLSSLSANASSNSNRSMEQEKYYKSNEYNQQIQQREQIDPLISPIALSPIGNFAQSFKSQEAILSNNTREAQILSDNKREIQLLSDNKREPFYLSDNNRHNFAFNDSLALTEEEYKMFNEKESMRQKQQNLPFNTPLMSPLSPNQSTQDLLRSRQGSGQTTQHLFEITSKQENSQIYGQNSQLGITLINPLDNSCSTVAVMAQQRFYQDKESQSLNIHNNINDTKDTTLKNTCKLQDLREKRKQQLIEQQMDNSSTKSKESSSSTKRTLISLIKAQTQIVAIKVINLIGLITFFTLASVTLQQYTSFMNSISLTQDNLTVQSWPQEVQIVINRSTKNLNLVQLERQNNFTFASKADQTDFDKEFVNRLSNSLIEFNDLVNYMETSKDGFMLFNEVSYYQSQFYLNIYYNPKNLSRVSSIRAEYYMELRKCSLQYSIVIMNQYINRQARNAGARLQEFNVLSNLPDIIKGIEDIQAYFQDYQALQDQQIQVQLSNLIAIILIISAACLFTILPLYSYIQTKKDLIINLFCTFPINQIQTMIGKIRIAYYQNKAMASHIKHIPQEIQLLNSRLTIDQTHLKKQNLSQITKLPRLNIPLTIIIILAYILLSIYPIVNRIVIQDYLDLQQNNIQMLSSINKVRAFVLESSAMTAFGAMMKIYPNVKAVKLTQYIDGIRQLMNTTSSMLDELTNVSNQGVKQGRYNQKEFDNFYFPLFENDICGLIGNNTQYILNATKFQPDFCLKIQNGFLQKGLKLSFKKFTGIVLDLYQIIEIPTDKQLSIATKGLYQWMNLRDYAYFIDYLEETLNIMKQFLIDNCDQNYQHLLKVQLYIIIYQLVLIAFIFWLGWSSFSLSLINSIAQTKQYLQVININNLLDNNYILTFVKNNNKL